jgi:putative salt-induced outer membrane protein YdiY
MRPRFYAFVVALSFLPSISGADVLVLKNGDRITGEIKRIWDDEVTIEPEYADEFQVDLPMVEYIESDRDFEVDLDDGTSVMARFAGVDDDGDQIITTDVDGMEVRIADVLELDEPEDYYDWESHVDLSSTINRGNTDSDNSRLRADGMFKHGDHRHRAEVTFFREEQSGIKSQDQERFTYSYNWLFSDPWFLTAALTHERDPIIQLDSRVIASAGIGHDIWNTPQRYLTVQLGAGYQNEDIGGATEESSVAVWALRFRHDFIGDDLEVFHNHTIRTNLSGRTNTSYRTSTGVSYEITDLLYAAVSLDFDYDTEPVDTAENEDLALMFGLGLEFE